MAESEPWLKAIWKDVYFCKSKTEYFQCSEENVEKVQYYLEHDNARLVKELEDRNIKFNVQNTDNGVDIWFYEKKKSERGIDLMDVDRFFQHKLLKVFKINRTEIEHKKLKSVVCKTHCPVYSKGDVLVFINANQEVLDDTLGQLDIRQACKLNEKEEKKMKFTFDDFQDFCKTNNKELESVFLQESEPACVAYFAGVQEKHTLKDLKSSFITELKKADVTKSLHDLPYECFDIHGNPSDMFMTGVQKIVNLGQTFSLRVKRKKIFVYARDQILGKTESCLCSLVVESLKGQKQLLDELVFLKEQQNKLNYCIENNMLFYGKESKPKLDEIKAKLIADQISNSWKEERSYLSYLKEFGMEMINSLETAFHVKIQLLEEEGKLRIEGVDAKALTDCRAQLKTFMGNLEKSEVFVPARVVDVLKEEILNVCKKHDCLVKSFCKTDFSDEDLDSMGTFVSWCDPQGMLQVSLSDKGPGELRCDAVIEFVDQHLFPLGSLRETLGNCFF